MRPSSSRSSLLSIVAAVAIAAGGLFTLQGCGTSPPEPEVQVQNATLVAKDKTDQESQVGSMLSALNLKLSDIDAKVAAVQARQLHTPPDTPEWAQIVADLKGAEVDRSKAEASQTKLTTILKDVKADRVEADALVEKAKVAATSPAPDPPGSQVVMGSIQALTPFIPAPLQVPVGLASMLGLSLWRLVVKHTGGVSLAKSIGKLAAKNPAVKAALDAEAALLNSIQTPAAQRMVDAAQGKTGFFGSLPI